MDEQKKRPERRISGRLTDTIRETDAPETQAVFTPRRPERSKIVEVPQRQERAKTAEMPHRPETIKTAQTPKRPEQKMIRPEQRGRKETAQPVQPNTASVRPSDGAGKRRRVQENEARMRTLWGALGILTVLLIIAIIYEIVLGHGIKQTGAQRMAEQKQENIIIILDETESEKMTDETEVSYETE